MQELPDISTAPRLTPDDIVRELRHLPSTPKILPRLKHLLADTNSSIDEIVALIRLDPGIVARVLQMGNSAYFSKGTRCHSVDEAVARVGFSQIFDLVSYAVASQVLVRPLAVYEMHNDETWRLSVACALAADELASHTGADRNAAYAAGLLHCLGMVVIDEWALREKLSIRFDFRGFPVDASESERAHFGFSQAEVGSALLCEWTFPPMIAEPVRWQYHPDASAGFAKAASLLALAKWIRSAVCENRMLPPPPSALLQTLRLNSIVVDKIRLSVGRRLEEICSSLDVRPDVPVRREISDRVKYPAANPGNSK